MDDCLFCKIVNGSVSSEKVYEDDNVIAFCDIMPQAKEHYLFVSKQHTENINAMEEKSIGEIFRVIKTFTQNSDLENQGFRVVSNVNKHGGQTVFHTHFHLLGGEQLSRFGN